MGTFLYLFAIIFLILFLILFLFIYPLVVVGVSEKVTGFKKIVWFIFTCLFSWPVFILFLLVA